MPQKTMQEYIEMIEGCSAAPTIPERLSERASEMTIAWNDMNATQQFIMTVMFARKDERDERINQLIAEKPAGVTWQSMLDFCFSKEDRALANQQLAERNRR